MRALLLASTVLWAPILLGIGELWYGSGDSNIIAAVLAVAVFCVLLAVVLGVDAYSERRRVRRSFTNQDWPTD